jgi:hypothetical protein
MSPISGRGSPFIPPPKSPTIEVSASELLALRAIVMGLVAVMADAYEKSGGGPAQTWINDFAVACADAITRGDIAGEAAERMRREALEHIDNILGGVRFPPQRDKSN